MPLGTTSAGERRCNQTATYTLGQLQGGFSFVNVDSGLVTFTQPPTGTYYFTIFLDEFSGGSFGYQDFAITSPLQTFGTTIGSCFSNSTSLCLAGGRFRVNVGWQALNLGTSGAGQAVPLTGDTGYFWFFSSSNVELVIKLIDGRAVNNHFWVFYGALTDVQYLITVTDTVTGTVKLYSGVSGTQTARNDTSAF